MQIHSYNKHLPGWEEVNMSTLAVIFVSMGFISFSNGGPQHCHSETGRCYWESNATAGTWSDGRTACQSEGGDLAVMETEELFDFVVGEFRYLLILLCNQT